MARRAASQVLGSVTPAVVPAGGYFVLAGFLFPGVNESIGQSQIFADGSGSLALVDNNGVVIDAVGYEALAGLGPTARFEASRCLVN